MYTTSFPHKGDDRVLQPCPTIGDSKKVLCLTLTRCTESAHHGQGGLRFVSLAFSVLEVRVHEEGGQSDEVACQLLPADHVAVHRYPP